MLLHAKRHTATAVLALWLGWALAAAQPSSPSVEAMILSGEAATALEAKDYAAAIEKLEKAAELRPDSPGILAALATAFAAGERPDDALVTLQRLAALGVGAAIDKAPEFVALRPRKEFQDVVKKLAANLHPKGSGEVTFSLREVTGLIEGVAWNETSGEFFFADVHHRAVWRRSKDGSLKRFTDENDDLLGVFALALDRNAGALWAAMTAVPEMRGYAPELEGRAGLAAIDLTTGAVRQTVLLPSSPGTTDPHRLGGLAITADGSILITDARSPVLWRYAPGAKTLERFVESPEFLSLHAVALHGDAAIVADQANGLLRVDLTRRTVGRLVPPENITLVGIDSLTATDSGHIIAVQNGVRPSRILRITLDDSAEAVTDVRVIDSGHLAMTDPSSGTIGTGGDFFFIGAPGWNRFSQPDARPTAPRPVPVFRSKLGAVR